MHSFLNVLMAPVRAVTVPFRIVLNWATKLISVPGKLWGLSLPTRVALLFAVFLVLAAVVTGILVHLYTPTAVHWRNQLTPGRMFVGLVLLISIPLIARQLAVLFLEGRVSSFPEIDAAWEAGITALGQNGLDLNDLPLFLILGVRDRGEVDTIMDSGHGELLVKSVPEGDQPLRWYASKHAAFLACPRMGCLSLSTSASPSKAVPGVSGDLFGTLNVGDALVDEDEAAEADEWEAPGRSAWGTLVGTLRGTLRRSLTPDSQVAQGGRTPVSDERELISGRRRNEIQRETQRLTYLAKLLLRARQPFCPLNGILTLVPWDVVEDTRRAPKVVPQDLQRDIATVSAAAEICVPVTVFVTGLESEVGFLELVRRVGREKSRQRFGKGYDPTNVPTHDSMDALAEHVTYAFENWVYLLFSRPDALQKLNNGQLYCLLCKIRTTLAYRLNQLVRGFGSDSDRRRILLGTYFAATGDAPDQRCFIEGVFNKIIESENEVEWSEGAVSADRRYLLWSQVGSFFNALVAIAIVGMIIWFYWLKDGGGP